MQIYYTDINSGNEYIQFDFAQPDYSNTTHGLNSLYTNMRSRDEALAEEFARQVDMLRALRRHFLYCLATSEQIAARELKLANDLLARPLHEITLQMILDEPDDDHAALQLPTQAAKRRHKQRKDETCQLAAIEE